MKVFINGGPVVTSSETAALQGGTTTSTQTAASQAAVDQVEAKVEAISKSWNDSGGTGGRQQAVASEVLTRVAALQGELSQQIRTWAKPGRERALLEMFGVMVKATAERDRLLLELRERLNDSPY